MQKRTYCNKICDKSSLRLKTKQSFETKNKSQRPI